MIQCGSAGVTIDGKHVGFGEFPDYVRRHLARVPRTLETEAMARELTTRGFKYADIAAFVRAVCRWGGYAGIAGRVLRDNQPSELAASFRGAVDGLGSGIDVAVRPLLALRQLGVSFASKHLRFLAPQVCAILDSEMAAVTKLRSRPEGLAQYSALCWGLAEQLKAHQMPNPITRPQECWYAADVDMALFAAVRCWR